MPTKRVHQLIPVKMDYLSNSEPSFDYVPNSEPSFDYVPNSQISIDYARNTQISYGSSVSTQPPSSSSSGAEDPGDVRVDDKRLIDPNHYNNNLYGNIYRLDEFICKGAFGIVFKATQLETNNNVIVKVVNKQSKNKDKLKMKLVRDSQIPKLLCHANIIQITDFMENNDIAYIVYPYLPNSRTLYQLDKKELDLGNKNNLQRIVRIFSQICDAVEYMHNNYYVHRDIKPQNILLHNDIAILIDFDMAASTVNTEFPIIDGYIGTPNYLAPEIWREEDDISYEATDIYSLGITMYYISNRKSYPYAADDDKIETLEYAIRNHQPTQSTSGCENLDKLIMGMISKNPFERPTMLEIRTTLASIVAKNSQKSVEQQQQC